MLGRMGRYLAGIGADKYIHFIACLMIAYGVAMLSPSDFEPALVAPVAMVVSVSIGAVKEIADGRKAGNRFSAADMIADACGALIGSAMWYWAALVFS